MNFPIDTDATGPFATGTGSSTQGPVDIRSIQPSWIADGYGVRGPQKPESAPVRAQPTEMPFAQDSARNTPPSFPTGGENCDPGFGASTSIKYIKATQWDAGTSTWVCVWLPTCEATCPA